MHYFGNMFSASFYLNPLISVTVDPFRSFLIMNPAARGFSSIARTLEWESAEPKWGKANDAIRHIRLRKSSLEIETEKEGKSLILDYPHLHQK